MLISRGGSCKNNFRLLLPLPWLDKCPGRALLLWRAVIDERGRIFPSNMRKRMTTVVEITEETGGSPRQSI